MPVPRLIASMMDSLKSAELIRELKAETEKLVESNSMVARDDDDGGGITLEPGFSYDNKPNHLITFKRNVIPYPDHNYGQQPPLTPPEQASPDPNEQTDTGNEDEDEEGVTRCICGFDHDDGYMICCDRCGSWQHIDCMGIKSDSVPETYHCDRCEPRQLDVERAKAIQQRKKDTLTDDDGDDDTDTDEESGQTYTAISQTPTRITLTANAVLKKKGKNRLKSTSSEGKTKKRKKVNRKRQRTSTGQLNEVILHIDSNSVESQIGPENFQEIDENIYDQAVSCLGLQDTENIAEVFPIDAKKMFAVSDVAENRKGLVATEDINMGQFVTEYKGKILLSSTYEEANPFFKRACPFLLHYNKIDQLELVIDARQVGSEARYIRRSCCPNAEVMHMVKDGNIRILVLTKQPISIGTEITIPFEFQIETYPGFVECACKDPLCFAAKHNQTYIPAPGRKRQRYSVTDPNSSTRNSASENQGETDSDDNDLDGSRPMSRRKKLSREERKLQAYLKQIEKMEKKEKKVKDPKATPSRPGIAADGGQPPATIPSRPSQPFESNALQSPAASVPRRISSYTPGSAKKRLSVNKKRPRISSCSSDPLSPDVSTCVVSTTVNATAFQEQILPAQSPLEHNGQLKQKSRKERDSLALSVTIDKLTPNFKDHSRRQRKDYIEAVAGSPTPPSTPGQLSPSTNQSHGILSVDTSSNLASPSGHFLSMQDRRSMLNGLLQIAEHNEGSLLCAGSPRNSMATSNGVATAEEVMGEMMSRENAALTPTGNLPTRRATKECRYFGSLKKRWLVQYDRRAMLEMRPKNGMSPISISNLMSEFSIQKRAEQIASYVFKTPKNCIPLKKRRLREVMLNSPEENTDVDNETSTVGNSLELGDTSDPSVPSTDVSLNTDAEKMVTETGSSAILHVDPIPSALNADMECHGVDLGVRDVDQELREGTEGDKVQITGNGIDPDEQKISTEGVTPMNGVNLLQTSPIKEEKSTFDTTLSHAVASNSHEITMKSDLDVAAYNSVDATEKSRFNPTQDLNLDNNPLTGESNQDLTLKTEAGTDSFNSSYTSKDFSDESADKSEATKTSIDKSDVNFNATIDKSDAIANSISYSYTMLGRSDTTVNTIANSYTVPGKSDATFSTENVKSEQVVNNSEFGVVTNDIQSKPSSILRDPRLSSSSSRSSRDSTDGHVFVRSDSVSSIEDATTTPKLTPDRKQYVEKMDNTANPKKKMSLREYRNRKKSKPSLSITQNNIAHNSDHVPSKPLINHQSVLLPDTDSLLTPRTVSLSSTFATSLGRDTTLTTSVASHQGETNSRENSTTQHNNIENSSSNGPMFEPVSPSEDFSTADSLKEKVSTDAMEIDDELAPTTNKIVSGMQNVASLSSGREATIHYPYHSPQHINRQGPNSVYQMQQQGRSVGKHREKTSPVYRQTQNYNQQFHG